MNNEVATGAEQRLPVTVLTGFLGAGKTTCLNHYLRSDRALGTAVLVNEFGEIDIDGAVLSASLADGSKVVTLPNGCVCCAVQEDLALALLGLIERRQSEPGSISRCIIETTGLADPGAIVRGLGHDPRLNKHAFVDQTITVCAADRVRNQLQRFDEAARQIGIADRIFISKTDLVGQDQRRKVGDMIRAINPLAMVLELHDDASQPHPFDVAPETNSRPPNQSDTAVPKAHDHSNVHTFFIRIEGALDPDRFRDTLSFLIMRHAENILRIKGNVRFTGEAGRRLLNGVHDVFSSDPITRSNSDTDSGGDIVFIGVNLPERQIRADISACELANV